MEFFKKNIAWPQPLAERVCSTFLSNFPLLRYHHMLLTDSRSNHTFGWLCGNDIPRNHLFLPDSEVRLLLVQLRSSSRKGFCFLPTFPRISPSFIGSHKDFIYFSQGSGVHGAWKAASGISRMLSHLEKWSVL